MVSEVARLPLHLSPLIYCYISLVNVHVTTKSEVVLQEK